MSSAYPDPYRHRSPNLTNLKVIPDRKQLVYTETFSKEKLDSFRCQGDPVGDAVCHSLHYDHGGLVNIHDLLGTVEEKAKLSGEAGEVFRTFLKDSERMPEWVDIPQIVRGQEIHAMLTPFMGISLFSGSLVGGAQFKTASVVTALAGNITENPTRRLDETSMLLLAIGLPGTLLYKGSAAHDSLTRVRLLHSALRTWLPTTNRLDKHRELVPERVYVEGEVPINQQDLAITLGIFCYQNLRSLRRLSIVLKKRDIEAYVMMWRFAGKVLGICEELLPKSLEYQEEFMLASMKHQGAPEEVVEVELKGFIDAFAQLFNKRTMGIAGAGFFNTYLQQLTRYLNGEDYVEGMRIDNLGDNHWSILFTRTMGYLMGTLIPAMPYGENVLIWWHTGAIRKRLTAHGVPVGHGAGSGADITSKL